MKQTILILSILVSVQCFGQKWHLIKVDENKEFPYEYWFQFEHLDDTCSYQLSNKTESQYSTISVVDNQGNAIIFADIELFNLDEESEVNLMSNYDGNTEFHPKNGKYRIEISSMNYDEFSLEFEIKNDQQIELNVKLGLAPELEVYQIDAKSELNEKEILEVIECVRKNRNDSLQICSDLKKYQISMHI